MNSNEFKEKINEELKNLNKEQLIKFLNNLIRKIPSNKYEEVLNMFENNDKGVLKINERDISEYVKQFKAIDDGELCFHATGYEEYGQYYNPWGGDWIWEYTDDEGIGILIDDAFTFAVELVNAKEYKIAKKIFDLIINTNYLVIDDDGGDIFDISLKELKENELINLDVNMLYLYAIYSTYQIVNEKQRAKKIYEYFKNREFKDVKIEDSFKLGTEILENIDEFIDDWINFLINIPGKVEYKLLKDAFEYTNYKNYNKYIESVDKNHPKIYLDVLSHLSKNNNIDELINVGTLALRLLDKNLTIRNDIALYLAKYDENNKEKYIFESFESNANVPNLLRIINNEYYLKYKKEIDKIINDNLNKNEESISFELNKNYINDKTYYNLQFFLGNFEECYNECLKHKKALGWSSSFIGLAVYLWLLVLNNNFSNLYIEILKDVFEELELKDNLMFLDNDYSQIFKKWKENFKIEDKDKYLKWLEKIIDDRVDAIVSNSHRGSYYKAAHLVVSLGEVLDSNNIIAKEKFVDIYHQKYRRRSSFRKELNKYLTKTNS